MVRARVSRGPPPGAPPVFWGEKKKKKKKGGEWPGGGGGVFGHGDGKRDLPAAEASSAAAFLGGTASTAPWPVSHRFAVFPPLCPGSCPAPRAVAVVLTWLVVACGPICAPPGPAGWVVGSLLLWASAELVALGLVVRAAYCSPANRFDRNDGAWRPFLVGSTPGFLTRFLAPMAPWAGSCSRSPSAGPAGGLTGAACGLPVLKGPVLIGMDSAYHSPMLAAALTAGPERCRA